MRELGKATFFQFHLSPFLFESIKKELHAMSCFEKECLAKKQLTTTQEAVGEAMPNMQGDP